MLRRFYQGPSGMGCTNEPSARNSGGGLYAFRIRRLNHSEAPSSLIGVHLRAALTRQRLGQLIQKHLAFVKRLHSHPLIASVKRDSFRSNEETLHFSGCDSTRPQMQAIRRPMIMIGTVGTPCHPHRARKSADRSEYPFSHRRRRTLLTSPSMLTFTWSSANTRVKESRHQGDGKVH